MPATHRVLRQCVTVHEAEIVRDRLIAAGVRAFVTGTDMATALSLGGAGTDVGVRLVVPSEDFDHAAELLAEDERTLREAGPWRCGRCDQPNEASFEVCWSCSKPREDEPATILTDDFVDGGPPASSFDASPSEVAGRRKAPVEDGNPYRPVLVGNDSRAMDRESLPEVETTLNDRVRRLLLGSIVAAMLFPPASTLVLVLLLRLPRQATSTDARKWRVIAASIISVIGIVFAVGIVLQWVW